MNKLSTLLVVSATASGGLLACATRPPVVNTQPVQGPSGNGVGTTATAPAVNPLAALVSKGPWKFTYTPGRYKYTIVTAANLALQTDTTAKRDLPTSSEQATLTIANGGEIQVIDPPPSTSVTCDSATALVTRAQQLLPKVPAELVLQSTWSDSSVTTGCRGSIPTTVKAEYHYAVLPETLYKGIQAVHVSRLDTISAQGAGNEGQHQVALTASGTGIVNFYFDPTSGLLLGSSNKQVTRLDITTSGQVGHFLQHVIEDVSLTKP